MLNCNCLTPSLRQAWNSSPCAGGALGAPLCLEFRQQLLNPILLLERRQAILNVVSSNLGLGLTHGLRVRDLAFHAIEGGCLGSIARGHASVARFPNGASAALLRDQDVSLGLRFGQFL